MREYTGSVSILEAMRNDYELEDDEWARLYDQATAYERRCVRLHLNPNAAPHGEPGTYTNWGCRCDPCTAAATAARGTRSVRSDFADDAPEPGEEGDVTPAQIKVLQQYRDEGKPLTEKGQATLDAWEAAQVL